MADDYREERNMCDAVRKFTNAGMGIYRQGLFHKHVQTHGKDSCDSIDMHQLRMGIKVEMEHTDDKYVACKIALDHLIEHDDYYTWLVKMESDINRSKAEDMIAEREGREYEMAMELKEPLGYGQGFKEE